MTDVIKSVTLPADDAHSIAPSDSDAECSSLCGSELEAEMTWGEGPIAPLRQEPAALSVSAEQARPKSNGNGSGRAKTPQKRGDPSPLQKSKRLINIHPMRSPAYLPKPNELPLGVRKQQRWFNDHHFGNKAASTRLEDLMEHMTINVEWRSNFQKLAEPENKDLQTAFRKGRIQVHGASNQPKYRRKDDWNDAEDMFTRIDRRARTLLLRSFNSFAPFIEAVEYVVMHFVQWREVPSDIEVSAALNRVLVQAMELATMSDSDVRLCIPLADSAFHRLIIHSVCQFYGVRSRTEANRKYNTKIMVLKCPKKKFTQEQLEKISFCDFIRETRLGRHRTAPIAHTSPEDDSLEEQMKSTQSNATWTKAPTPRPGRALMVEEPQKPPQPESVARESPHVLLDAPSVSMEESSLVSPSTGASPAFHGALADASASELPLESEEERQALRKSPPELSETPSVSINEHDLVSSSAIDSPAVALSEEVDRSAEEEPAMEKQTVVNHVVDPSDLGDEPQAEQVVVIHDEGADIVLVEQVAAVDPAEVEGGHATIAEVTESADALNPADTKEQSIDDVISKIKSMMACEIIEVLESGEILVLPKGWSTRASKTHGGKTYYVSPYGQTQWLRPPMKTGIGYKWVHEIEVTFGTGRLGLNLKQISSEPGQIFSDILVHIAEIYKLSNGLASPAEIYNWGVKPEKRLQIGMRMTAINGIPLTGCTYYDVLDRINRLPRPLRIKFADISKGIVGRAKEEPTQEETEEEREARATRVRQSDLRTEYFQVLVAQELHLQVWKISKNRVQRKQQELQRKEEILTAQVNAMAEVHSLLEKEKESLIQETTSLSEMIEQLHLQEVGQIPSPEVVRAPELQARNVTLDKEIKDLIAENDDLRQERVKLDDMLEVLQKELDVFGGLDEGNGTEEIDFFSSSFLGTFIERGSIDRAAENARDQLLDKVRERRRQLQWDLEKEDEQVRATESDIVQFKRQMASADAASQREDDLISGDKPPQLISLETKVEMLRKNLHETVTAMAAAAKDGDRAKVDNLSIRRTGLKEELKNAVDEVQKFELEFNVRSTMDRRLTVDGLPPTPKSVAPVRRLTVDGPSATPEVLSRMSEAKSARDSVSSADAQGTESAKLQDKLTTLRADLHDTVTQLARAASTKDAKLMKEMSGRRLVLKEEMKSIQDEYQQLTRESLALPPGSSFALPPVPRLSTMSSSSLPPRASSDRQSMDRIIGLLDERERSNSRSSSISTASHASLAMSVDSNANYPTMVAESNGGSPTATGEARLPMLAGLLMKHPSHSNEKGLFGNMSLRGVRERYCVLDGAGTLKYFKRKGDREPRGSIPLDDPALEVVYAKTETKSSEFSICTPTHQNKFVAKNRADMLKWVDALEQTHASLIARRSGTGTGLTAGAPASTARDSSSSSKESTLRHQESVASQDGQTEAAAASGQAADNENGGLAPIALAAAAAADSADAGASAGAVMPRRASESHQFAPTSPASLHQLQQHQHRATLGF